jgi:hypothetical protein
MFNGREVAIQSVMAHNTHENIGCIQEGGTSLLAFGTVTEYLDYQQLGKDKTGLGQWSVMTFKGTTGFKQGLSVATIPATTRILIAA